MSRNNSLVYKLLSIFCQKFELELENGHKSLDHGIQFVFILLNRCSFDYTNNDVNNFVRLLLQISVEVSAGLEIVQMSTVLGQGDA